MSKKKNKKLTIVVYIVLLLVFVALVGGLAVFTNGFKSDFKEFFVVIDKDMILDSADGYMIAEDKALIVDVKYTFGAFVKEQTGYSVKVVPNANIDDFDFTVDGDVYSFKAEKDLTAGFDIKRGENSFTIKPVGSGLQDVLEAVFPDSLIEFDNTQIHYSNLFTLVITSYDGSSSVYVHFGIEDLTKLTVELDKTEIVF